MATLKNLNIITDSQAQVATTFGNDNSIYNGIDIALSNQILLHEETGAACFVTKLGEIMSLRIGSSNAQTLVLSRGVSDFDYFIIMTEYGATQPSNTYATVFLPSLMWQVFNSSTGADRICLKGASTYYVNCYFNTDDLHLTCQAAGSATSVYVFGVQM